MMSELTFEFLAEELAEKAKGLGGLNAKLRFVFEGEGVVHIDATVEPAVVSRDAGLPADFTIIAPLRIWLDLRARKIAPHVAAMTRKLKIEGNVMRGMQLAPRIMTVL